MNVGDEHSKSLWMDVDVAPDAKPLQTDETADAVVVGSGIAGLSTAYELSRRGQRVIVLDRGKIGRGMTARTSAHLSANCDDSFESLIKLRGVDVARQFYLSQSAAIDRIEAIQRDEGIACDFRRVEAFLFLAPGMDKSVLDKERDATRQAGMAVEDHVGVPFRARDDVPALRYPNQATFHPTKYLQGLARAIRVRGGKLYADTAVLEVEDKDGGVMLKTEAGHTLRAQTAVVATNSPINNRVLLHSKQAPYRTYVLALAMPRGALPDALYWDTLDPYHYVRVQPGADTDTLLAGGCDHKSGEADDAEQRLAQLEAWIRNLMPQLGNVTHRWSGQVMDTVDYTAFIGRNPGDTNVFVHTGDSGQGLTHGVAGSLLISGAILDNTSLWTETYEPARKTASALSNFVSENLTMVKNLAEYVAPGEVNSFEEVKRGHGAIVRRGLHKIAAYRDDHGTLHAHSAVCTHLGCHLHWNSFETCWDCPCHGSQFSPDGAVLNGPAIAPLAEAEVEQRGKKRA